MKRILYVSLAALGIGVAGCSNEDEWGLTQNNADRVSASIGTVESRTAMSGNSVHWADGDEISIFISGTDAAYTNNKYTLATGSGSTSATFEGTIEGENPVKKAALYPYGLGVSFDGTSMSLTLGDSYTYSDGANVSAPMACMIGESTQSSLSFKNAGALLQFKVNNIPAGYNQITVTSMSAEDSEANTTVPSLTGKAKITFENGVPTLTMDESATGTGKVVTIMFTADESGISSKTFYFPLPVADYPALQVAIGDGTNSKTLKTKALNAARNMIYTTTVTLDQVTGEVPTEVSGTEAATTALANGNNAVSVTDVASTETSPTISLPTSTTGNDESVSISFDAISTTSDITIQAATDVTTTAPNVTIAVPESTESSENNFVINLPASTVTLAANGETATFNKVEATTADQTLVVDGGVTIKTLTIKKGNVRLKAGAKIEAMTNNTESTIRLIVEDSNNSSYPANLADNIEVVDAAVVELETVAAQGGTYTLAANVTGDFVISASDVTINLNGYKVTNKAGDTFTVNNGCSLTINGDGTVDNVTHAKACIYNNGTVVLNGGTYIRSAEASTSTSSSGGNSYYNILNHGVMTINSGVTISSTGSYSSLIDNGYYNYVSTNERLGYVAGTGLANPSLTINGGTFSGGINTIKNDDGASLVIADGTFSNTTQATVQNNNVAEIRGGTFSPTSSATHAVESKYYATDYNKGETTIAGGTFNGLMYVSGESASLTITGGTFSDPSALQYLGENANVTIELVEDSETAGFKTQNGQTVVVDLGQHVLTLADPTVGSTGTETNSCQLLQGSTVTFKNGTLTSENTKIVIQNYCDLLLENVTISATSASYVVSNNNGTCTITGSTITAGEGKYAFDVCSFSSYPSVTVTVNTGSTINGKVCFDNYNGQNNNHLVINGGTFNGDLELSGYTDTSVTPDIKINGGEFGNYAGWGDYNQSTSSNE